MNRVLQLGGHLLASLFYFFALGMAIAFLLIQNAWLDMRFSSEYIVFISMLAGVWFYFLGLFMDAGTWMLWAKRKFTFISLLVYAAIILLFTIVNNSVFVLPAYVSRKGILLDSLSLGQMNSLLVILIIIGTLVTIFVQKQPLAFKKGAPINWNALSTVNRFGIMFLFGITALFLFIYLGHAPFQISINQAIDVMKQADVEGFRDYLLSFGPWAAVISGLLMVFQSVLAPLPAFVITFANGLLFGWFFGAILSWCSAMLGAILCFYLAKILGRPVVGKIVTKQALQWWDKFFAKYGKHSVFIARLVPIVSFDLVSYAAGVTSISFWQFFWATGLGQLPATILYSYLGQNATDTVKILFFLFTIVIALAVIGAILRPRFKRKGIEG